MKGINGGPHRYIIMYVLRFRQPDGGAYEVFLLLYSWHELAFVFWDNDGILLVAYLEKGATISVKLHFSRI
jgi:hypothetical protein